MTATQAWPWLQPVQSQAFICFNTIPTAKTDVFLAICTLMAATGPEGQHIGQGGQWMFKSLSTVENQQIPIAGSM